MPFFHNSYSTPVVWEEEGKGIVGLACAQRFTAFSLTDGKEAWWVNGLGFQSCSTPVAVGDRLLIASAGLHGEMSNMTPPPPFEEMIMKYDRDGRFLFAEYIDDPATIIQHGYWRDAALHHAMPYADYARRIRLPAAS